MMVKMLKIMELIYSRAYRYLPVFARQVTYVGETTRIQMLIPTMKAVRFTQNYCIGLDKCQLFKSNYHCYIYLASLNFKILSTLLKFCISNKNIWGQIWPIGFQFAISYLLFACDFALSLSPSPSFMIRSYIQDIIWEYLVS